MLGLVLVQDRGEVIHRDISAVVQAGAPSKLDQERRDLETLLAPAADAMRASMVTLGEEYSAAASPEATFVTAVG